MNAWHASSNAGSIQSPAAVAQTSSKRTRSFMSIIVGTDLSEASARTVIAAAQLARRMSVPLHVVHALDLGQDQLFAEPRNAFTDWVTELLQHQADRLRREGLSVDIHMRAAPADEALLEVARQADARLIVVAASQRGDKQGLGSRADRIAAQAHVPVLIVRDPKPIEAWSRGERALRIVLGADLSLSADAAIRWVSELAQLGSCEIVLAHLYWPPLQFQRLGLSGVRSLIDADAEVTRTLRREFEQRLATHEGLGDVKYRLEPNLGRFDARLASIALEENADLVVVGSHGRNAAARLWDGSVARGVSRTAPCSVVCVPLPAVAELPRDTKVSNVLVATDFSELGNAAIPLAYAVAPPGASVHLVHVIAAANDGFEQHDIFDVREANAAAHAQAEARLRALEPALAQGDRRQTLIHVLSSKYPAQAIAQAAERLDAHIICLGTHGRTGVTSTLLGSQAQAVLASTHRPLLLARAPLV
jgi:nucleotide-binding universal stress UspA family protein